MCGIFGFTLTQTVPLSRVFRLLEKLEVHQYPHEPKPVGGYLVPVNRVELLAPWLGLAALASLAILGVVLVSRRRA